MLDYSKFHDVYAHFDDPFESEKFFANAKNEYIMSEIKRRQGMIQSKQEKIEQLQYENSLIYTDIFSIIREDVWASFKYNLFAYFKQEVFYNCQRYFNKLEDLKNDEDVSEEEFTSIETTSKVIRDMIKDKFFGKYSSKFELVKVLDWNYTTAYVFVFKSGELELEVSVPMYENTSKDNYGEMLSGYAVRYNETEYVLNLVANGMDYEEVGKKTQEWLKDRFKKEKGNGKK